MTEREQRCSCGTVMETLEVCLTRQRRCPACAAEESDSTRYALDKGEVPPDLTPLRSAALQRLSANETVELKASETTPLRSRAVTRVAIGEGQDEADPLAVDTGPSLLDDIRSGLGTIRDRLTSRADETAVETPSGAAAGAADPEDLLPEGTVLGKKFKVLEPLGTGGMGTVYKAQDTSLERFVALKVLSPQLTRNQQFTERFVREARAVARLTHPHITTIYQYNQGDHFFAMEYVEGENLADRVKRTGPVDVPLVLEIARQTALGLKAALSHKIIHRDIKPSNLLVTAEGAVKITDFGLAKARASVGHTLDLTSTGVVMGTPLFMSPEQGRGGTVDQRSDIYSLGATLFFLLYGCPPFEADSPIAIILKHINDPVSFPDREDVPGPVKALLLRMMVKDPERRIASYEDLLEALERIERGETVEEEVPTRVIVLAPRPSTAKRSLFKVGKLSVARTNLKLGRRDKAVSLLSEAVEDGGDPSLRAEAARLLLELHEADGDAEGVRRMASIIAEQAPDASMRAYADWKLAELDEEAALADLRRAIARYEHILDHAPDELPRAVIESQVRRLRAQLAAAEREMGTTQVVLPHAKS